MLFTSLEFALFLGGAYGVFLLLPARFRRHWLLVASYVFFGYSSPRAVPVLVGVSLISFWGGRWIERAEAEPRRQLTGLSVLVGVLAAWLTYFKCVPLIVSQLKDFAASAHAGRPELLLLFVPVGVSYYIFQGIGYLVDVYWGKPTAGRLTDFLLFMAFFPKVLMGPIERGEHLLPQIEGLEKSRFDYDRLREGLLLFGWGLFKKLVVAERLAVYVNRIYSSPADEPGLPVVFAAVAFSFQLYSDFSGYTDMALGVGKLFGLELTQNFDRPYTATTIQDFWRRWHLSFSTWIRDYMFLPLRMALRRAGKAGLVAALMITFFVVGVWHGIGWPFAVFGLLQGFYMVVSTLTLSARNDFWERHGQLDRLWLRTCRRVGTFSLVTFSLVFFRADSVPHALSIIANLVPRGNWQAGLQSVLQRGPLLLVAVVVFMELAEHVIRTGERPFARLISRPWWQRWPVYIGLILAILAGSMVATAQRFIYLAF
jgi:D-alanyl-lipoteichoic acid acyltransferase DltB (MBOAT superfamily)